MRDQISITDLELRTEYLERDLWNRKLKLQPLNLNLKIKTTVIDEALTDSLLEESLNYGKVTKVIEKVIKDLDSLIPNQSIEGVEVVESKEIPLEVIGELLCKFIIFKGKAPNVELELTRPRALLTSKNIGIKLFRSKSDYLSPSPSSSSATTTPIEPQDYILSPHSLSPSNDKFFITDLRRLIIIGVNDCERLDEQEVILNLEFSIPTLPQDMSSCIAYTGTGLGRIGWKGWREVIKKVESVSLYFFPLSSSLTDS